MASDERRDGDATKFTIDSYIMLETEIILKIDVLDTIGDGGLPCQDQYVHKKVK